MPEGEETPPPPPKPSHQSPHSRIVIFIIILMGIGSFSFQPLLTSLQKIIHTQPTSLFQRKQKATPSLSFCGTDYPLRGLQIAEATAIRQALANKPQNCQNNPEEDRNTLTNLVRAELRTYRASEPRYAMPPEDPTLAALRAAGDNALARGNLKTAQRAYQLWNQAAEKAQKNSDLSRPSLARSLFALADMQRRFGDALQAEALNRQAQQEAVKALQAPSATSEERTDASLGWIGLASLQIQANQFDQAQKSLQEALALDSAFPSAANQDSARLRAIQVEIALGDIESKKSSQKSQEFYQRALDHIEDTVFLDLSDKERIQCAHAAAHAFQKLGKREAQLAQQQKAAQLSEAFARENPDNPDAQFEWAEEQIRLLVVTSVLNQRPMEPTEFAVPLKRQHTLAAANAAGVVWRTEMLKVLELQKQRALSRNERDIAQQWDTLVLAQWKEITRWEPAQIEQIGTTIDLSAEENAPTSSIESSLERHKLFVTLLQRYQQAKPNDEKRQKKLAQAWIALSEVAIKAGRLSTALGASDLAEQVIAPFVTEEGVARDTEWSALFVQARLHHLAIEFATIDLELEPLQAEEILED